MLFSVLTIISYLSAKAQAQCVGCGEFATCDATFVENAVYGCGGIWQDTGVLNGEYLCGDGYSICDSEDYAESLGLTYTLCMSSLSGDNAYYVAGVSSDGSLDCSTSGSNDLFGCANAGNTPCFLYVDSSNINCGPFGAQLSTDSNDCGGGIGGWTYGWEIGNGGDANNEFVQTTHVTRDDTVGGVLCCIDEVPTTTEEPNMMNTTEEATMTTTEEDRMTTTEEPRMNTTEEEDTMTTTEEEGDAMNTTEEVQDTMSTTQEIQDTANTTEEIQDTMNTTEEARMSTTEEEEEDMMSTTEEVADMASTTEEEVTPPSCVGCGEFATCDVTFVENAVYGCGGIWEDSGVLNGEYLCGDGYSICDSEDYAESLGLTYTLCMSSLSGDNAYYVSGISSDGSLDCSTSGSDDLFGCANADNAPCFLYIDSSAIDCGPFGAQLSTESYDCGGGTGGWTYGWEIWNGGDANNEFDQTTHITRDDTVGGVMCCIDEDMPTTTGDSGDDSGDDSGGVMISTTDVDMSMFMNETDGGMDSGDSDGSGDSGDSDISNESSASGVHVFFGSVFSVLFAIVVTQHLQ